MAAFWDMTPHETFALITACQWQIEYAQKRDMVLAWHVAALSRAKRLPALQRLLHPPEARALHGEELERRRRERDEMLARIDVGRLSTQRRRDAEAQRRGKRVKS